MRFLLTALALLLLAVSVTAMEAEPYPARAAFDRTRDLEIQVRARRILLEDEELAPFNLGVTVRDGVAVLWGPVSSPEVSARAMKKVENVRGVFSVRNETYLSPSAGKLPEPGGEKLLPDLPEHTASALPDRRTGTLPGQLASKKVDEPIGPVKRIPLLAPTALPDETQTNADAASAVERIRSADERYRLIRYEMKEGAIYLRGTAKPEHVMAFARAISNIPGVDRVVLPSSR